MMQALRKEPLTVYGDGKQTRSFQYVSDLVWGCPFPSIFIKQALFFPLWGLVVMQNFITFKCYRCFELELEFESVTFAS